MAYGPQFALPARRDQGTLKPWNEDKVTNRNTEVYSFLNVR
jgi:hypothetical protein